MNYRLILKRIALLLLTLLVVAIAGFVIWASMPLGPMAEAELALQSDARVSVTVDPWLVFEPMGETAVSTAFIFYPGGRVDYQSYAPAARAIAANHHAGRLLAELGPPELVLTWMGHLHEHADAALAAALPSLVAEAGSATGAAGVAGAGTADSRRGR